MYVCIYIYIFVAPRLGHQERGHRRQLRPAVQRGGLGRGHDTVEKPPSSSKFSIRAFPAQIDQFELSELVLLLELDKQFPVEQFEASRAIRGSSISVSITLPPLKDYVHRIGRTGRAGEKGDANSYY